MSFKRRSAAHAPSIATRSRQGHKQQNAQLGLVLATLMVPLVHLVGNSSWHLLGTVCCWRRLDGSWCLYGAGSQTQPLYSVVRRVRCPLLRAVHFRSVCVSL